jgi:membrane-associated phospholipid phosphatase
LIVRTIVLAALAAVPAGAQSAPDVPPPAQPVFRAADAAILGAALAGSVLLVKYDAGITAWKGLKPFRNSTRVRRALDVTAFLGGPGSLAVDAAIWGSGRIAKNTNRATDGETALEAAALSGAVTFLVKGIVGRARPYVDSTRADDFGLGRGFLSSDAYRSFPSGHTTAAFAFATAITARLSARGAPQAAVTGPLLYGLATFTGIARLYNHNHWASDCLMGAAIGTISGLAATRWHERHP